MPILARPGPPPAPAPIPGVGFATAAYIDPDGFTWPLTSPGLGWFTLSEGVSGLDMAPYELTKDDHPRGGSRLRHVQPVERSIVWPLHVYGDDHEEFIGRWRDLGDALSRTLRKGPGWLEIARPSGSRRRIRVIYQEGFEGQGEQGTGIISDTAIVTLYCPDPYWVDPVVVSETREHQATELNFLSPFPSVSSSQALGATTLVNPGRVDAWPRWEITGPATQITITNVDTGESFVLDPDAPGVDHGPLLAEEKVIVTTDPPRVRYQDGSVWTAALNWPGAILWSLPPGRTNVSFQVDGAGDGSTVAVSFEARYEMA